MIGEKSWADTKQEMKDGWKEMRAMSFSQLLTQCAAGFALAMLAGFCLCALVIH